MYEHTPVCAAAFVRGPEQPTAGSGTHKLPDVQSLNRFIDDLYGAHYSVQVDRLGEHQFIHLSLEIIDDNFLGEKGILVRGLSFLRDVLRDGSGFQRDYLEREKYRLMRQITDGFNDKLGYAQRRCSEEMCRGEPWVCRRWATRGFCLRTDPTSYGLSIASERRPTA